MGDLLTDEMLVQWSYGTKLNKCSVDKVHTDDCDGNCEKVTATKGQVDLHNEVAIWSTQGNPIIGLPDAIAANIPINGFPINILAVERRLETLLTFLVKKQIIDEQEYLEYHRVEFAAWLKNAREMLEKEKARASIIMPHIGLAKPPGNGGVQH